MKRSGLPGGVLNIVTGSGAEVGDPLVTHQEVKKISFTGGIETGRHVAVVGSEMMKRVTLELGGNDPMIVCSDVDPVAVAEAALLLRLYNCGQICTSPKRLIVEEGVYEAFVAHLKRRIPEIVIGDGTDPSSKIGPLNSEDGRSSVKDAVLRLESEGAEVIRGRMPDDLLRKGFFYPPVLVTGCDGDSPVLQEEIFGPVIPVIKAGDLDEALEIANNTRYGLGASVWTQNIKVAEQSAEELEAGIIWVNQHMKLPPEVPFGGVKGSGSGRENGLAFIEGYTEEKTILISR
jgi:acyl-CoA reductase-like NAD-dependent aldehyde dehydrogenase